MFNCGETQIDTILKNKVLILSLYPQEVEYTLARQPMLPSMLKLMKSCMIGIYVLATSKNIFPMGPQLVEKAKQID